MSVVYNFTSTKKRNFYTLPRDAELTPSIIEHFIDLHKRDVQQFDRLDSYRDGNVPRMNRKAPNQLLAIHDYAGYIVSLYSAYLTGQPVQYQVTEGIDIKAILDAYNRQGIADLDAELAEDCSQYGRAFEVVYATEDSRPESARLDVKNTFIVQDDTVKHDVIYAICVTPVIDDKGEAVLDQYDLTIYDKTSIRTLRFGKGQYEGEVVADHSFGDVPVVPYINNRRMRGDFESVISLIDAINILQSDRVIDREKLMDAILAISGGQLPQEAIDRMKESRIVGLPADARMEYIIKNIDEQDADVVRSTLEKALHKFSMTPDMSDENFAGNSSGVALAYKLHPFEMNTKAKERYFERALKRRFQLYNNFLSTQAKMKEVDLAEVDVIFTRSLPKNDLETSQMINNLIGTVDKALLASQLSFVRDGEETVRLAEKEERQSLTNGLDGYGTSTPSGMGRSEETEEEAEEDNLDEPDDEE